MRTVHWVRHQPSAGFSAFLKRGFWEVTLIGESKAPRLCTDGVFCGDIPSIPGAATFGAKYGNLVVTSTAHGATRHTFVLIGHVTIGVSGSIVTPSVDYWPCDGHKKLNAMCSSGGPGFLDDVKPIAVAPGQQVYFTVTLNLEAGGG